MDKFFSNDWWRKSTKNLLSLPITYVSTTVLRTRQSHPELFTIVYNSEDYPEKTKGWVNKFFNKKFTNDE